MLTITPAASDAIRQLVEASELPESAGIRIGRGTETPLGVALDLALVDTPDDADQVSDEGATVFVDSQLGDLLDDKVLDAQVADGQVAFALREEDGGHAVAGEDDGRGI
jgi:Fe-S cluster assembly iron-binding protein IscA